MHAYRTHTCGDLRETHVGETVRLSGWCHRIRDHGGVLFIDLRDHYGLTQCVVDPDSPAFKLAETFRAEWVVRLDGEVKRRPQVDGKSTDNDDMETGKIELYVRDAQVLGQAAELPLPVFGDQDYPEETRLKYRFLDLRRERIHNNIMLRGRVVDSMRSRMKEAGFNEFQTPILTASSPEGARDFLVPSRIHPGKFYALPQAPQQYKQLLMMAGFDRYFQIAPCFRDEDPRADRLPGEFYQLDLEMSFVTQDDVLQTMEPVITRIFEQFAEGKPVTHEWPRIPYSDAMRKYGSDKPDLRNPLVMQDVSEHFRGSGFKIFARMLEEEKNQVWAIPAPSGGQRTFADRMNSWAQGEGQPGLGYILFFDRAKDETSLKADKNASGVGGRGPLANNIGPERVEAIRVQMGLTAGDACFFVAGIPSKFAKFAGAARIKIGEDLNLVAKDRFELAWIVDFPMFEWNEDEKRIDFAHNPFSMPNYPIDLFLELETGPRSAIVGMDAGERNRDLNDETSVRDEILGIMAFQYDIVCNGFEIASGGIRNHRPEAMVKAFEIAGYSKETVVERFGGMYRAFQYGAPPHGGMAAGVDRIIMLLAGEQNLREVALFPMNQRAEDILMGAPSTATPKQLRELHLRVNLPEKG